MFVVEIERLLYAGGDGDDDDDDDDSEEERDNERREEDSFTSFVNQHSKKTSDRVANNKAPTS